MTDMPAAAGSGRAPGGAEPGLIHRRDLMAALNRAAQKRVTIISAPAGTGKTSLLRAWADQPGQDCRVAFITVRPGQHDMQLFWLTVLGTVRAAAGTGEGGAQLPPVTPGSDGSAMVDKVLSELEESCDRFVLVIDDLHDLSSPEAAGQLTALLTRLLAARWLAAHGQAAEAIGHLQAAGDWNEAARMLTDHALSLTLDGQAGTVAALLRSFPARTGEDSPDLTLVRAIADQYQLRLDQTDAHLREVRAYAATTPLARRYRLELAIASVDLLSARLRGHFDSIFEQAGALLCPGDGQTSADAALSSDLKAVALLNLGVTEAWSLRLADSERHLTEGAALAGRIGRPYLEVACLAHLGFASTRHSFAMACQRCEEAITVAARHGWDAEAVIAPALAALANALSWTGQFDLAEQWLDRSRRAPQADGEPGIRLGRCQCPPRRRHRARGRPRRREIHRCAGRCRHRGLH
jgi:AAA ATPase domain